jgi:hypothetical protein
MKSLGFDCMVLLLAATCHGQDTRTITKASISFHTTSDDKDGDSQVRDRITCSGQDYFQLFCCSSGRKGPDHWDDNTDETRTMDLIATLKVSDLSSCAFVAGLTAKGNDKWIAIYTIDFTLSDGTRMDYSLGEIWLDSENSNLNEKSIVLARLNPTFPQ